MSDWTQLKRYNEPNRLYRIYLDKDEHYKFMNPARMKVHLERILNGLTKAGPGTKLAHKILRAEAAWEECDKAQRLGVNVYELERFESFKNAI